MTYLQLKLYSIKCQTENIYSFLNLTKLDFLAFIPLRLTSYHKVVYFKPLTKCMDIMYIYKIIDSDRRYECCIDDDR